MPRLLTSAEVAQHLQLTPTTVLTYARNGKLPGSYIGRTWKFKEADVTDFIESSRRKK